MKASIIQIGNSQGIRIPKTLLEQLKFEKTVELDVTSEGLLLRPAKEKTEPREGWSEMFAAALASPEADDDFSDWNEASLTEFDEKEW